MDILLLAVVIVLIAVVIFQSIRINKIALSKNEDQSVNLLKMDVIELNKSLIKMRENLDVNLNNFNEKVSEKLERNNFQLQNSMAKQISESSKIVEEVSKRLQNPKQRGVLGEFYLEQVLENVLPPNAFEIQYKFKNGEIVDAAIFLDKNKILPVDSKFSLENYNRMIESKGEERKVLVKKVRDDLKKRIDETSKYIRPNENTMDFAFMFIPSESLYYDALTGVVGSQGSERDLIEYAFRDKHVIVVSPTSFMAYLQTVLQGLKSLKIEEQSKEIQKRVAQLNTHISKYEDLMQRLGKSLGTTVNHFNNAHKELGKIDKDVIKISGEGNESGVEPQLLDKPIE